MDEKVQLGDSGPPVMGTGERERQFSYQRILMGLALSQGTLTGEKEWWERSSPTCMKQL